MKQFKVGILGATGAVGREMMKILEERKFPVAELLSLIHISSSAHSSAAHFSVSMAALLCCSFVNKSVIYYRFTQV